MIADDMKAHDGLITLDDLKNYEAKERTPLRGSYRGHEIISMPPPSSGGIVMLEVLNMLEGYDVRKMQHNSAAKYHVLAEAMRRAFADRAEFMGDPDFADVPTRSADRQKIRRAATLIDRSDEERRSSRTSGTAKSAAANRWTRRILRSSTRTERSSRIPTRSTTSTARG